MLDLYFGRVVKNPSRTEMLHQVVMMKLQLIPKTTFGWGRLLCLSSSSVPIAPPELRQPLFLRSSSYSAAVSAVCRWHDWAVCLAGAAVFTGDDAPSSGDLLRELSWLSQDVFGDRDFLDFRELKSVKDDMATVKMKVPVENLYELWRQRIEERRPFQYIVGCERWRDLVLCVQEGVLIPRPETEMIVDLVEDVVSKDERMKEGIWADLGTGSGAIAIGVARFLGDRGRVLATDFSRIAVDVASFNVRRYGMQEKVEIRESCWFEELGDVEGKLSGIVSNPPYIPSEDMLNLQAEVGKHEPRTALDGGVLGLDHLLHLCDRASSALKPGGFFAFETNGDEQSKILEEFMRSKHHGEVCGVKTVADFAGIKRFITGFHK